ncbi:MAG: hypothetical protein SCH66_05695 [Methanolobus sp.]|nr:hypothetical protein [Methanolobus sp.]
MYWVKFWEDEKKRILREVPVHADTEKEAKNIFHHDFPNISHFQVKQF